MTLNVRQQCFVDEYLVSLDAARAAIKAGYSRKRFRQNGSRLLKTVGVGRAVAVAMKRRSEAVTMSQDTVLSNLVMVLERCLQQRPRLSVNGKQLVGENGDLLWTFDVAGATRALELLMKHKGMLSGRVEPGGRNGKASGLAARLGAAWVHCDDGVR